jgi:cytochrome c oxidase assembly protein subunit 15
MSTHVINHPIDHSRQLRAVALAALSLCLCVVVLGAYVRLSAAGLGCPDWPGCYGHLTPSAAAADVRTAAAPLAGRPLDVGKAWREMAHRYAAGTLGGLILLLAGMGIAWRRERIVQPWFVGALLLIVLMQGMLGMLTVTWQLTPLIVSLHLLFGFTTLSLLWWLVLTLWRPRPTPMMGGAIQGGAVQGGAIQGSPVPRGVPANRAIKGLPTARRLALAALLILGLQIALGGWTSSNYAAIACPDLPTCQGSWWPQADFRSAYVLWAGLGINYEGGVLANPARVAIHLTHRYGAAVVSVALLSAALAALLVRGMRSVTVAAAAVILALALQLVIGISMVLMGFPLWLATAHNAGAALLLLAILALNRSLRPALAPAAARSLKAA